MGPWIRGAAVALMVAGWLVAPWWLLRLHVEPPAVFVAAVAVLLPLLASLRLARFEPRKNHDFVGGAVSYLLTVVGLVVVFVAHALDPVATVLGPWTALLCLPWLPAGFAFGVVWANTNLHTLSHGGVLAGLRSLTHPDRRLLQACLLGGGTLGLAGVIVTGALGGPLEDAEAAVTRLDVAYGGRPVPWRVFEATLGPHLDGLEDWSAPLAQLAERRVTVPEAGVYAVLSRERAEHREALAEARGALEAHLVSVPALLPMLLELIEAELEEDEPDPDDPPEAHAEHAATVERAARARDALSTADARAASAALEGQLLPPHSVRLAALARAREVCAPDVELPPDADRPSRGAAAPRLSAYAATHPNAPDPAACAELLARWNALRAAVAPIEGRNRLAALFWTLDLALRGGPPLVEGWPHAQHALHRAALSYDPRRGYHFASFAWWWVRNAVEPR